MTSSYDAAWVPDDDPHRDWDVAATFAVNWVLEQGTSIRGRPVLVTNVFGVERSVPALRRLLQSGEQATPQSQRGVVPGTGPVLAYVPYEDTLALAVRLARKTALCIVETVSFPILGWARAVEALDLTRGQPTQPFPPEVAEELERIIFYGNNGWAPRFDANQALRILTDLRQNGFDDLSGVVAYAGARGKARLAMGRLRKLAIKAGFTEPSPR